MTKKNYICICILYTYTYLNVSLTFKCEPPSSFFLLFIFLKILSHNKKINNVWRHLMFLYIYLYKYNMCERPIVVILMWITWFYDEEKKNVVKNARAQRWTTFRIIFVCIIFSRIFCITFFFSLLLCATWKFVADVFFLQEIYNKKTMYVIRKWRRQGI